MNAEIELADQPYNNRPEWLRIEGVEHYFGLKKTFVYELRTAGKITSRVLRKRGSQKGVRLYSYDSVREFIEANAEVEDPASHSSA